MKKLLIFITLTAVLFQYSCSKDAQTLPQDLIIGTWVSEDKSDTLEFVDNDSFYKSNVNMRNEHFDYKILNDSIRIGYSGNLYIYIVPSMHHYNLSTKKLTMDFSNKQCYGFALQKTNYYKE